MSLFTDQLPPDFELTWIDEPFVTVSSPEEIAQMREDWTGPAYSWKRFVENEFPNLDANEEKRLKRQLNIKKEVAHCNSYVVKRCVKTGKIIRYRRSCGNYAHCPACAEEHKREIVEQIRNINNPTLATKSPGNKEQYFRLQLNGETIYIVENGDGESVTWDIANQLADENKIPKNNFRMSGSLGKVEKSPSVDNDEPKVKIKRRPAKILAPRETAQKIEKEADEMSWPDKSPETPEELQEAVTAFENALKKVAQKYDDCEGIHYQILETVYINMKEVNWEKPPG